MHINYCFSLRRKYKISIHEIEFVIIFFTQSASCTTLSRIFSLNYRSQHDCQMSEILFTVVVAWTESSGPLWQHHPRRHRHLQH